MSRRPRHGSKIVPECWGCGGDPEPYSRYCQECNRSIPHHLKLRDWYRPRTPEDRAKACRYPTYSCFSPWVQRAFDIFAGPSTSESGHPADEGRFHTFVKIAFRLQWRRITASDVREALLLAGFTPEKADYYAEEFTRCRQFQKAPVPLEF